MGLEGAIEHKKEKRKPYYGSKAFDGSCRNHGGCPWCETGRSFKKRLKEKKAEEEIKEFNES